VLRLVDRDHPVHAEFVREPANIGAPGLRVAFGFTITGGKIVAIDILADPARLRQLDLAVLSD
jgi:hypothetical protein